MRKLGLLTALVIGLSACGGGDGGGSQPTVTCNFLPTDPNCAQTSGPLDDALKAALNDACTTDMGGTPVDGAACPGANLIGTCTITESGFTVEGFYYSVPAGWTATTAQADCSSVSGSVWHPAS